MARRKKGNPYLGIDTRDLWTVRMADGCNHTVYAADGAEAARKAEATWRSFGRTEKAVSASKVPVSKKTGKTG
jgi:hypothetical protein